MSSPLAGMDEVPESLPEGQSSLTPIDFSSDPEDSDESLLVDIQEYQAWVESRMGSRPVHDISSDSEDSDESLSDGADGEDDAPRSLPEEQPAPRHNEPQPASESDWTDPEEDSLYMPPRNRVPSMTPFLSSEPMYDIPLEVPTRPPRSPPKRKPGLQPLYPWADINQPRQSQNEAQLPRGRKRAASSSLPARPPPVSPSTMALSPIWQSLPEELVQLVLHELVTIHLWEIDSDPFYPWETLRQLNHQQRRRIDALYRQLLLPIFSMTHWVEFCLTDRPMERFMRAWQWDKDEAYDSTNDTIILSLFECEFDIQMGEDWEEDYYEEDGEDGREMHPVYIRTKGWNKFVNSVRPGGLYVDPEPHYWFALRLDSRFSDNDDRYIYLDGEIPASHVPYVQDSDDDSIKVSSSQLIGALIRAWKKEKIEDERKGIWANRWYISLERLRDLDVV